MAYHLRGYTLLVFCFRVKLGVEGAEEIGGVGGRVARGADVLRVLRVSKSRGYAYTSCLFHLQLLGVLTCTSSLDTKITFFRVWFPCCDSD